MNAGGQIRYVYTWCGPQVGNKCFRLPNLDSKMPRAPRHQLSEAYMTIKILKPNYHANLTHACYLDAMFLTLLAQVPQDGNVSCVASTLSHRHCQGVR